LEANINDRQKLLKGEGGREEEKEGRRGEVDSLFREHKYKKK
jgi:hypothetical protein